jgi:hypothetical protein
MQYCCRCTPSCSLRVKASLLVRDFATFQESFLCRKSKVVVHNQGQNTKSFLHASDSSVARPGMVKDI